MTYKIYNSTLGKSLLREIDNIWIPFDELNNDYLEYLKWVEEGNIAEEINSGGV